MKALLGDGPLEGREIGVDVGEGHDPPHEIEVDVEDGNVYSYRFKERTEGGDAVYSFHEQWQH
jgi:hypothetical protein